MKLTNEKLRDIIREELDRFNGNSVNEGFSTWEIEFGKGKVSGVDYGKAGKLEVIARNAAEAIKKAVKIVQAKAGFKGSNNDWMAVDVDSVIKESTNLRSILEGITVTVEEKKMALYAIESLAKHRGIDLATAAAEFSSYILQAVQEIQSDIKKGKIKEPPHVKKFSNRTR